MVTNKEMLALKEPIRFETKLKDMPLTFYSTWGLFSPEAVDEGTSLLLKEIEVKETDHILDLGCGYGALGIPLAKIAFKGETHMVDKDFVAIGMARKNAKVNQTNHCKIYLSNAFSYIPPETKFDVIVSNLPAKVGKEMFEIIMYDAKKHLKPGGKFYVVTISGLKEYIKRNFKEVFGNYDKLAQSKTYTVALAVKE